MGQISYFRFYYFSTGIRFKKVILLKEHRQNNKLKRKTRTR